VSGRPYRVLGYKGKQVRDNIHSFDLVEAFVEFIRAPRSGEVYNIGGSRHSNCSMLEAIALCEEISGRKLTWSYEETEPDRRPHLVDQRRWKIPETLSHLEISLQFARNSGRNSSRSQCSSKVTASQQSAGK
jgi:UDP-glucose 4-epimerase